MGVWGLIQIVFDIFLMVGLGVCILRLTRRPQDDPRMSRALQLLQSKLSVLEDLSDRTDSQVQKITSLMEQKVAQVQEKIETADQKIQALRDAVDQGIETVRLAQSSIKPEEILEQKSSIKYTKAAKLASEGQSTEQICAELDLNRAEVEFIVKVNRDGLRTNDSAAPAGPATPTIAADFSEIFDIQHVETSPTSSLGRLAEEFRKANHHAGEKARQQVSELDFENSGVLIPPAGLGDADVNFAESRADYFQNSVKTTAPNSRPSVEQVLQESRTNISADRQPNSNHNQIANSSHSRVVNEAPVIRKVIFPRIDMKN